MDHVDLVVEDVDRQLFRVHRSALTSPDVYRAELDRVFDRVWVYLGHESEVARPGDFVSRTVAGRPLIISRDQDGDLHVLINSCPHRGAEVCREPKGNTRVFKCFYHAWTFDGAGRLIGIPGRSAYGPGIDFSEFGLRRIPRFENYRGFLFGSFGPEVEPLVDYLGGARYYIDLLMDQSEVGMEVVEGTHRYSVDANWKLLVENSIDGYHLKPVHVTYFNFLRSIGDAPAGQRRQTRAMDLGGGHAVLIDHAPWGRPVARWVPSYGEELRPEIEKRRQRLIERFGPERARQIYDEDINLFVFPNLVINDVMGVVIRTIWPVGPDRMEVNAWALAPADDTPELRANTLRSFVSFLGPGGFATPDDMEALESCQRGFGAWRELPWSDLSRGMNRDTGHESSDEVQLRAFWRRWHQLMSQPPAPAATADLTAGAPCQGASLTSSTSSSSTSSSTPSSAPVPDPAPAAVPLDGAASGGRR